MDPIQTARYIVWRLNERLNLDERGQVASEYIGMIVVIAAIIAVLATNGERIANVIVEGVENAIRRIFGGGQ